MMYSNICLHHLLDKLNQLFSLVKKIHLAAVEFLWCWNEGKKGTYSAAIHQDGEKPVLFVPYFFRELLGLLLNWRKQRPKGLRPFASFGAKRLRISHSSEKKVNVTSQKGQGNRIWDAPPSALPGANLLKRLPNISKSRFHKHPLKTSLPRFLKAGRRRHY